jgi:hypothetical protein
MADEKIKVLSCPFCGGSARRESRFTPIDVDTTANVVYAYQCENRKTTCPVNMRTHYGTKTEALEQWNTRADSR